MEKKTGEKVIAEGLKKCKNMHLCSGQHSECVQRSSVPVLIHRAPSHLLTDTKEAPPRNRHSKDGGRIDVRGERESPPPSAPPFRKIVSKWAVPPVPCGLLQTVACVV